MRAWIKDGSGNRGEDKQRRGGNATGVKREGGRQTWQIFIAASTQKGKSGLQSDRSRNKSKSLLC